MIDSDLQRAAMLVEAQDQGKLTDLTIVGVLTAVRSEAITEERTKQREKLETLAAQYRAQGRADIAYALAQAAKSGAPAFLGAPTVADVADA